MSKQGSSQSCKLCGSLFSSEFGLLLHFQDEHFISRRKLSETDVALLLNCDLEDGLDSESEQETNSDEEPDQARLLDFLSDRELILLQEAISPSTSESEEVTEDPEWEDIFDKVISRVLPSSKPYEPEPVPADYPPTSSKPEKVAVFGASVQAWVDSILNQKPGDSSPDNTKSKAKITKPARKIVKGKAVKKGPQDKKDGHRYACIFCGKSFFWSCRFFYHIRRSHTLERPYFCKLCDQSFAFHNNLSMHMKSHTGSKVAPRSRGRGATMIGRRPHKKCKFCAKSFPTLSRWKNHMRQQLDSEKKRFKCEFCCTGFKRRDRLQRHVYKTVSLSEPFSLKCSKCDQEFTEQSSLKTHMATQLI